MAGQPIRLTDLNARVRSPASEPVSSIPPNALREIADNALQSTKASGAGIALRVLDKWVWEATAGHFPYTPGTNVDADLGLTAICAARGMIEWCTNTLLDSRVNADLCRELAIEAMIVAPLFREDQFVGFLQVVSNRPYTFGMRELCAIEALGTRFGGNWEVGSAAKNDDMPEPLAAIPPKPIRWAVVDKTIAWTVMVALVAFVVGAYWRWNHQDPDTHSARERVTLVSRVPTISAHVARSRLIEGGLLNRVDPVYPVEALRRGVQGQVVLQVQIRGDGFVADPKVVSGEPMLAQAALEAVRHWRFAPYRIDHKAVELPAQITIEFSLER